METRKNTWERKKIVTLPPFYTWAPGSICPTSLVVIHKGVEVIIIGVSPAISALSVRLDKQIDWAVIDHMFLGVASSTDSKVTDFVRVSPSMTETTLGFQTMMCSMAQGGLLAGWAGVHWAEEAMVTEIRANVTEGIGGRGAGALDQDSRVLHKRSLTAWSVWDYLLWEVLT